MALQPLPPVPNTRLVDDPERDAIWRRYLEQLFNRVIPLNTGSVTSINVSSLTSGLTFTGGPVSTVGTILMTGTLNVSSGGSGANTLTGYIIGNGTSPFTATSAIHTSSLTGVLPIANGGTATSTPLTSSAVMVSNGTAIVQGPLGTSTTVLHGNTSLPFYAAVSLTSDVSGILPVVNGGTGSSTGALASLSSMAYQSSSNVAIVGGSINGTQIGNSTASSAVFTTVSSVGTTTGTLNVNGGGLVLLSGYSGAVDQTKGIRLTNNVGTIVAFQIGASSDSFVGTSSASQFNIRTSNTNAIEVSNAQVVSLPVGQLSFPATQNPSTGANTLDDYEEGTWTPDDASGAALTFTSVTGQYVKIGKFFSAWYGLTYPSTASGATAAIGSIPFTIQNSQPSGAGAVNFSNSATQVAQISTNLNTTNFNPRTTAGAGMTNAQLTLSIQRGGLFCMATA